MKNLKIAGIICEYDPFHRGHEEHIMKTRAMLPEGTVIVCAMSGNYTQRGDFAMFPKWERARCALTAADLVVELPLNGSLSSSEQFALRGVQTLAAIGADYISFGSESGDIAALSAAAGAMEQPAYTELLKEKLSGGITYAAAAQQALFALTGEKAELLSSPNDLLGIAYIRAIRRLGLDITPVTVQRNRFPGAASSSVIRQRIREGIGLDNMVGATTAEMVETLRSQRLAPVSYANCEKAIMLQLRSRSLQQLSRLPHCSEGLDRKLYQALQSSGSFEGTAQAVKSKRYTRSRINRLLMCALLGLDEAYMAMEPAFIRLLGANDTGKQFLRLNRAGFSLPLITKAASVKNLPGRAETQFNILSRSTDIYNMARPTDTIFPAGSEWRESPVFVEGSV